MNYIAAQKASEIASHLVKIHEEKDFEGMRKAGRLAAEVLDCLVPYVKPGVTTGKLDQLAYDFIVKNGAYPAPLYYRGFPKSICTSINHVICHGIPGDKKLNEGDTLNIDVTVIVDGWHGDTSRMFFAGKVPARARRLSDITYQALTLGIEAAQPGNTLGDIGHVIQTFAEGVRCSVVTDFCGHGLGRVFHDAPNVMHYGRAGTGKVIKPGMFFTVEPMINLGRPDAKVLSDGWTAVTRDRQLSMQFEHSIGITENGPEIFTLSPGGFHKPPYDV
jgi:methionyl aminopeptidase